MTELGRMSSGVVGLAIRLGERLAELNELGIKTEQVFYPINVMAGSESTTVQCWADDSYKRDLKADGWEVDYLDLTDSNERILCIQKKLTDHCRGISVIITQEQADNLGFGEEYRNHVES